MTNKEAIDSLKGILAEATETESAVCYVTDCDAEPLRMAIEALEKQVPKRTTYIHLNTRYTHWGRVRHDQFRCCNCGLTKEFVDGHASQYKFCPQCGLEIDWSEEDD